MKLVILDRDGVINFDSAAYIKRPEEWRAIPGSIEAIARLTKAGYTICIATNQAALERGLFDVATLERIHRKMQFEVAGLGGRITRIFHCPHAPETNCECRKPRPGLLFQAASEFGVSLNDVPFIGDSRKDLEAAVAAGALPVLVRTGSGIETERSGNLPPRTKIYDDLEQAVNAIIDARNCKREVARED